MPLTGVIREMMYPRKDKESIYMHLQSFTDDANGVILPQKNLKDRDRYVFRLDDM